ETEGLTGLACRAHEVDPARHPLVGELRRDDCETVRRVLRHLQSLPGQAISLKNKFSTHLENLRFRHVVCQCVEFLRTSPLEARDSILEAAKYVGVGEVQQFCAEARNDTGRHALPGYPRCPRLLEPFQDA